MEQNQFGTLASVIHKIGQHFGSPAIGYLSSSFGKPLDYDDIPTLSKAVDTLPKSKELVLVLNTGGGNVDAVRHILLALREAAQDIRVVVVDYAISAGSLLCMGAKDIFLPKGAYISPVDPLMSSSGQNHSEVFPQTLSSEDIRAFSDMAGDWFGLTSEHAQLEVLRLLCTHVFPPSISKLYKAEQYILEFGAELLRSQLPDWTEEKRLDVTKRLVRGYPNHSSQLHYTDLSKLGFCVYEADSVATELIELIKQYWVECDKQSGSPHPEFNLNSYIVTDNMVLQFSRQEVVSSDEVVNSTSHGASWVTCWEKQ